MKNKKAKLDWYGREGYNSPRSKRKKDLVRSLKKFRWFWLRSRGRCDIADASNQAWSWCFRDWSLLDMPRKVRRLPGRVRRRLEHEELVVHSHEWFNAVKENAA